MNRLTLTQDNLEERAAIMAEGNGWSQAKAERTLAALHGKPSWRVLIAAAGTGAGA